MSRCGRNSTGTRITLVLACALAAPGCGGSDDNGSGSSPKAAAGDSRIAATYTPEKATPTLAGPHRDAYSFFDNRPAAHLLRSDGVVVDAGDIGFVKYLRYRKQNRRWKLGEQQDGRRVAVMSGGSAAVLVPTTQKQRERAMLSLQLYSPGEQALDIQLNGNAKHKLHLRVEAGWNTKEIKLDPSWLTPGENEFRLFASRSKPLALQWLSFGYEQAVKAEALDNHTQKALLLPKNGGFAHYMMIPDGAKIVGSVSGAGCSITITADTDGSAKTTGTLRGKAGFVDLGKLAGSPARVAFVAQGCDRAELHDAKLVVAGAPKNFDRKALTAKPKYVVFWIMDSLRASAVRLFREEARAEIPTLTKLAAESAVFLQAYPHGNESKASHGSYWTSYYPGTHRYFESKGKLEVPTPLLPDEMRTAGLKTFGVSGNGYIIGRRGFGNRWTKFTNHLHDSGGLQGDDILKRALSFIKGETDPWFLYLGTIDTHVTWRAKEPWISKYDKGPYKGRFVKHATDNEVLRVKSSETREIERVRAIYDSNVSYQDDLLRQLLEQLEAAGIADDTMLIITADHGDELWEANGRVGHAGSLRETVVHVPLIVHYKPLFPAARVKQGVGGIDVLPTIADVLGIERNKAWQGRSLLPLAHGVGVDYPEISFATRYEQAHAVRLGSWKLQHGIYGLKLFDLSADPEERKNLLKTHPIARRTVADPMWIMRAYSRKWKATRWGNAANLKPQFASDLGG